VESLGVIGTSGAEQGLLVRVSPMRTCPLRWHLGCLCLGGLSRMSRPLGRGALGNGESQVFKTGHGCLSRLQALGHLRPEGEEMARAGSNDVMRVTWPSPSRPCFLFQHAWLIGAYEGKTLRIGHDSWMSFLYGIGKKFLRLRTYFTGTIRTEQTSMFC